MKRRLTAAILAAGLSAALVMPGYAVQFSDVPENAWYAEAAGYCQEVGLMSGTGAGRFSPDGVMTRAMLCAVLRRAAGSPQAAEPVTFTDVAPDSWCAPAVSWAAEQGIMSGYGSGRFGADDPVTREQLAAVLWRFAGSPEASAPDCADEGEISSWASAAVDWVQARGLMIGNQSGRFQPQGQATRAQAAQVLMNYTLLPGTQSVVSVIDVLCRPGDILPLEEGGFLVTDSYYKVVWQVRNGTSQVCAGVLEEEGPWGDPIGGYNDGTLETSLFREPWALAPFLDGWAVSDPANHAVRLILPQGVQTLNCSTRENLPKNSAGVIFDRPTGLASDEEGNLYIADTGAGAVRRVTPQGEVTTMAANLQEPMGLCWLDGALYAAETGAHRILKITPDKAVTTAAGTGEADLTDGPARLAGLSSPQALTAGPDGTIYIADVGNSAIRCLKDGQVTTLYARNIASTQSFFPISPAGMMVSGRRLFVCDRFSHKVVTIALG